MLYFFLFVFHPIKVKKEGLLLHNVHLAKGGWGTASQAQLFGNRSAAIRLLRASSVFSGEVESFCYGHKTPKASLQLFL